MKKIVLAFASVLALSTVFAQSDFSKTNGQPVAVAYHHSVDVGNSGDRDAHIEKINREFDRKISAVRRNRHLAPFERERQIRLLDRQRDEQIQSVKDRFSRKGIFRSDRYDKRYNERW